MLFQKWFLKQLVPSKEERWGKQAGDKCGELGNVYTLLTFQNGEPFSSPRFVENERLCVRGHSEEWLLPCSFAPQS